MQEGNHTIPVRRGGHMTALIDQSAWESLSYEEKNHALYLKQVDTLKAFLERGAISKEQYEKSLHDLTEKMHEIQTHG